MIELVHQLGLVEWRIANGVRRPGIAFDEDVADQPEAVLFQQLAGAEQVALIRHVEHPLERDAPRVACLSGRQALGMALADEHGHALVDGAGQVGVGAGRKTGQVWVLGLNRPGRRR